MAKLVQERLPTRPRFRPGQRVFSADRWLTWVVVIGLLALWQGITQFGGVNITFFPPPTKIFAKLYQLWMTGVLWHNLAASLIRIGLGFLLGAGVGLLLGIVTGLSRWTRAIFNPIISTTYPIPKSALLPLMLLIFGMGQLSKVVLVAIGVFYMVVINTATGVQMISPIYMDVGRNYGAGRWGTFWTIALPGALPMIMAGLNLGMGQAILLIAIAEMVGANSGIGFMIWNAWQAFQVDTLYVGLICFAVIGFFSSWIIQWVSRKLIPWQSH